MSTTWRRAAMLASLFVVLTVLAACSITLDDASTDGDDQTPDTSMEQDATPNTEGQEDAPTAEVEDASDEEEAQEEEEFEEPPEVELIDSEIDVEVTSNDYTPDSDVLIALHGEMDPELYLISPEGEVLEGWRVTNRFDTSLLERRVLSNGNIMFVIRGDGAYEMSRDGEIVWAYEDDGISHHGEILPNGNVLVAGAICDCVQEIDYETQEQVYYWDAHEAFPDYSEGGEAFSGGDDFGMQNLFRVPYDPDAEYPNTWGHANYTQKLDNGNYIVSLRNFDTILEINEDGETVWSFGPGIVKHQHTPVALEDGTMLIFDNGNHRAVHLDRGTGEVLWSYDELDSAIMGDANLMNDGNYKVVDSLQFRVDVVSPEEDVLWSMQVETEEDANGIYRAHFPDLED